MDKKILDAYKKAGEIARLARIFAETMVKEGASYLEVADRIESRIKELGGGLAFPVNISVNEIAAHHIPSADEKNIFKQGDLVKIDIGVRVDGYIADTAFSVSIGKDSENERLIEAAEKALASALSAAKLNAEAREVGKAIADEIKKYDLQPIRNLSGHLLSEYDLHAGTNIPNYDNGDKTKLKEGQAFAIEPFATSGEGLVIEGKSSEVFRLEKSVALRTNRDVLKLIEDEYKGLPFARRWLIRKFGSLKANLALKELLSKSALHEYKELKEKSGQKVSQAEHTVLILEKTTITTI